MFFLLLPPKAKNQRKLTAVEAFLEKLRVLIATHPKSLRFADAFSKAICCISTLVFLSNPSKADNKRLNGLERKP